MNERMNNRTAINNVSVSELVTTATTSNYSYLTVWMAGIVCLLVVLSSFFSFFFFFFFLGMYPNLKSVATMMAFLCHTHRVDGT